MCDGVVVFYESRHAEETISTLVIGDERAVLIDSGCGIAPLRALIAQVTSLPAVVVNTHTHADHVGGNHEFEDIVVFDHRDARRVARNGISHADAAPFAASSVVDGSFPPGFDPGAHRIAPFTVTRWVRDGDRIDLGDRELEIIHTPGESPDHVVVLDPLLRMLFTGDLYFDGTLWAHRPENDPSQYAASFRRLLARAAEFDTLMPSHNAPCLPATRLQDALAAFEAVDAGGRSGGRSGELVRDSLGTTARRHDFGAFSITTPAARSS
ncbi:MAG TPA: MBL fold metallo-hydrolase [Nocardioides sp.]|nr:MBL fold metallo-hydrolase [Nocardioides sp.]